MKLYLPIILGVVCLTLVGVLVKTTKDANARHDTDVSTISSYSNRLDAAETELNVRGQTILTLSNSLDECRSASMTLSNQLADAQTTVLNQSEQITNLTGHLATVTAEKLALDGQRVSLTNQVFTLTNQLVQTRTTLAQANKDYALLENRFRIDVAERLVMQRKFYNPDELQTQMDRLKTYRGAFDVTADQIYAGLNVEVKSNGTVHVISPD